MLIPVSTVVPKPICLNANQGNPGNQTSIIAQTPVVAINNLNLAQGIAKGGDGTILGDVIDNGIFAIDRSDVFTFGGAISGSGGGSEVERARRSILLTSSVSPSLR